LPTTALLLPTTALRGLAVQLIFVLRNFFFLFSSTVTELLSRHALCPSSAVRGLGAGTEVSTAVLSIALLACWSARLPLLRTLRLCQLRQPLSCAVVLVHFLQSAKGCTKTSKS
jgi:hypothetical protein